MLDATLRLRVLRALGAALRMLARPRDTRHPVGVCNSALAGPTTEELEITNITERHSNLISPAERTLTLSPSREPAMLPAWKRAREYVTYEAKSVPRYHPCSTQRPSTHGRLITGQRAPQGCKRPGVLAAPLQSQIEKRRREAARKPSVAAASREYTLHRAPKHMKVRVRPAPVLRGAPPAPPVRRAGAPISPVPSRHQAWGPQRIAYQSLTPPKHFP